MFQSIRIALCAIILASCPSCVSLKRFRATQNSLNDAQLRISDLENAKKTLTTGYAQMAERYERCRDTVKDAKASLGGCDELQARVEKFKKYPHTCKHKFLLDAPKGLGKVGQPLK